MERQLGFSQNYTQLIPGDLDLPDIEDQVYLTTSRGIMFSADCLDILSHIRDETIHCIFADPPFNLGKDYGDGIDDELQDREYLEWSREWLSECCRVLVPGGSIFVYNIPKWLMHFGGFLNEFHMEFRHWIAIKMTNGFLRKSTLYPAHYGLLYYTKGEPRVFNRLRIPIQTCRHCGRELRDYGGHRDKIKEEGLNLSDFWEDTSPVRHSKFKTRVANELKPVIPERAILMSTQPNDIILDPFGGGGGTYQVAELNDRNWIGMEIGSCEPILERLEIVPHLSIGEKCPQGVISCFDF